MLSKQAHWFLGWSKSYLLEFKVALETSCSFRYCSWVSAIRLSTYVCVCTHMKEDKGNWCLMLSHHLKLYQAKQLPHAQKEVFKTQLISMYWWKALNRTYVQGVHYNSACMQEQMYPLTNYMESCPHNRDNLFFFFFHKLRTSSQMFLYS